jgi:A/G-specific adenine glycosylase
MTITDVAKDLAAWYKKNKRDLPWRKTEDEYAILISELMLQQTQVPRVKDNYYHQWLKQFPDWQTLAKASKAQVLKQWSGLGYNNRALRLHELAKIIAKEGKLPQEEKNLVKLPGIGPYTAGAIQCFARDKPGMCIDVNIHRIIKRLFYTKKQETTKRQTEQKLMHFLQSGSPRILANALMDFGSAICTASEPKCNECPLRKNCKSKGERLEEQDERKKKRQKPFLYSNRWWRGNILKQLHKHTKLKEEELFYNIRQQAKDKRKATKKAFSAALKQLQKQDVVNKEVKIK